MSMNAVKFGAMLRALRGAKSQREAAKESGVYQQTISRMEGGQVSDPSFVNIVMLARTYGVTPTDMAVLAELWESPDPEEPNLPVNRELAKVLRDITWEMRESPAQEQVYLAGILRGALNSVLVQKEHARKVSESKSVLPQYLVERLSEKETS